MFSGHCNYAYLATNVRPKPVYFTVLRPPFCLMCAFFPSSVKFRQSEVFMRYSQTCNEKLPSAFVYVVPK